MRPQKRSKLGCGCDHLPPFSADTLSLLSAGHGTSGAHLVCLACGLCSASLEEHGNQHAAVIIPGHEVVLDRRAGELYCTSCADYVYDQEFDTLKLAMHSALHPAICGGTAAAAQPEDMSTSQAVAAPAAEQISTLLPGTWQAGVVQAAPSSLPLAGPAFQPVAGDGFPAGLRGLNNMGNTCFMNSVLQGLLHAPLLRNYFLLGQHCRQACPTSGDGGFCVSCELDEVFNEAYSGLRTAYSPAQFLYTWWMLAGSHLGSYQQHDAHEFLLFMLEMLNSTPGTGNISSKVFGGTLRSDVICCACGHASTTQDPFTHLSLDIPPREALIPAPILPRPGGANAGGGSKAAGPAKAVGKGGGAVAKGSGAAARRSGSEYSAAAAVPAACAPAAAAAPAPSSSLDRCTSSGDAEVCDEAAGSTLLGPPADALAVGEGPLDGAHPDDASQLEAASAVGGLGVLVDDSEDAAQDTLSSPRSVAQGAGLQRPRAQQLPAGGMAGAGQRGTVLQGRPPIPGRAGGGRGGKRGAVGGGGGSRSAAARRQSMGGEAERGPGTVGLPACGNAIGEASDTLMASQDALAAVSNVPGSQSTAAAAAGVARDASGAMPPQLAGYQRWPAASLVGCLHRFVRQEELGPPDKMQCARCNSQHAIKQLSLRQLPPVLVLHTKRFEHSGGLRATARKLETELCFPLTDLDMRPFLSSSLLRARYGLVPGAAEALTAAAATSPQQPPCSFSQHGSAASRRGGSARSDPAAVAAAAPGAEDGGPTSVHSSAPRPEDFLYDLFAVVCHRGSFQGGHYVAYVRGGDGRWYLCDDAWVVGVDEAVVQGVQAYMLFYARKHLEPPQQQQV